MGISADFTDSNIVCLVCPYKGNPPGSIELATSPSGGRKLELQFGIFSYFCLGEGREPLHAGKPTHGVWEFIIVASKTL